jgi:hypothetical protein
VKTSNRVFVLVLALLTLADGAYAGTDPAKVWFTLESENFAVHSYDGGEALARRVASAAEDAKRIVDPLLGYSPSERVHIRLVDDVDGTNGFAWVVPYDTIVLYAHPPAMGSALSSYDDWLRLLVIHEYAHIVHLDHAPGFPELVNGLLGKTLKPNQALPRWFTEGLATWVESEVTGGGRVGSSRFEMMLRAAALAGRLPSLAELTGEPLFLPRGTSWYLYGSLLIDHIAREAGVEAIRSFIRRYGRRAIGYSMNILARQTLGKDFGAWHAEVLNGIRSRAQDTALRVERAGPVEGRRLTDGGESRDHPQFTPDGRSLLLVRSDGHQPSHLTRVALSPPHDEEKIIRCDGGCGRFAVGRDGKIIASMGRVYRQVYAYRDLFELPMIPNQPRLSGRRLTRGHRAQDPALTRDGRTVWSVRSDWGRTWLEAYDRRTGDSVGVWRPPEGARVDAPQPHPDGRRLFVSMHHRGNRDLFEVDHISGQHRRLTWGASDEVDPALSPDGRWLLYASDADGIYDIYARDVSESSPTPGRTVRLTRVLTGAFSPQVSPDGSTLIYVGWTVDGDELYALDFDPAGAPVVVVPDPRPGRTMMPELREARVTRRDYSFWPTLLPRRLNPTVLADSNGLARVGLSVGGLDVTERIGAGLSVLWDGVDETFALRAETHLSTSWPDITLAAGGFVREGQALFSDAWSVWPQEVLFTELSVDRKLAQAGVDISIGGSATLLLSRALRDGSFEHAPDAHTPRLAREGLTSALEMHYGLSDVSRPSWAVSPHQGFAASFALRLEPDVGAAQAQTFQVRAKAKAYFPLPWSVDHVFALSARGAWSGGPEDARDRHRLGGVPDQDLLADLLLLTGVGSAWLRGYEPGAFTGTGFHLISGEWRLPIHRLRMGADTLPIFARDVAMALFADAGWAGDQTFEIADFEDTRVGIGAELRMTADLLFGASASFRLGYAYGLGDRGIHHAYLLMAPPP